MASQGRYDDALALIKKQNPLPAVCGRICNRRCEDACTRGTIDEAIAIDAVKKFIAERDLNEETRYIPPTVIPASIHMDHFEEKIAIIGGGPAGLTAAFYLAEKGYRPTVFEKNDMAGGTLRYGIPSYKLEKDVIEAEIEVMRQMGVEIKTGVEVGKDVTLDLLRAEGYKAFYIAIGCSAGRRPGVPGDDAEGRFAPTYDENDTITIQCDRVIFAVGQASVWGDLVKNEKVEFNGPAIAAGKIAAESLHRYVHDAHMKIGRNRWEFTELDKDNISVPSYDNSSRQIEGVDSSVPAKSFKDAHLTLTEEQVKIETSRCLGCGATVVDPNKCIGCGVCTTKCEFDAITLHRDHPECSKMTVAEDKFKEIIPYQLKRAVKIALHKKN